MQVAAGAGSNRYGAAAPYDALSEHADAAEMRRIFQDSFGGLVVLGLITGALYFVPVLNLVAPTFSALEFIHYCLAELRQLRQGTRP